MKSRWWFSRGQITNAAMPLPCLRIINKNEIHTNFPGSKYKNVVMVIKQFPGWFSRGPLTEKSHSGDFFPRDFCLVFSFVLLFQGQFSHIGASFHYRTPFSFRVPQHSYSRLFFWLVNGSLLIVPQILAYRCLSYPSFFVAPAAATVNNSEQSVTQGSRQKKTSWSGCHQVLVSVGSYPAVRSTTILP